MTQVNTNKRWVQVLSETANGFIEFKFFVADADLCVELILPKTAFKEFCDMNNVAKDSLASLTRIK